MGVWGCDGGNKVHGYFLQLTIAKSPVCDSKGFVVTIEEKGLLLDWVATGNQKLFIIAPNLLPQNKKK